MISPDLPRLNAAREVSNSLSLEPARRLLEPAWSIRRARIASQHDPANCSHFFHDTVHIISSRFHSYCDLFSSHSLHFSELRVEFAYTYPFVFHPPCRQMTTPIFPLSPPNPALVLRTIPTMIPSCPSAPTWMCASRATKDVTRSTAVSSITLGPQLVTPPSDDASPRMSARD